MGKNRCKGTKKNGERCNRMVDGDYCYQHQPDRAQKSTNSKKDKLTDKQLKAIKLLIKGDLTKTKIAKECDIGRRTLYTWLDKEDFQEEYERQLQELKDKYAAELNQKINKTISNLDPRRINEEKNKAGYLDKLVKIQNLLNGEATDIVKSEVEHSGEIETKGQEVNIINQIASDKELRDNLEEVHRKRQELLTDTAESK